MIENIKRLGTDTAIYGVSTIVGRFLTFILTPIYANILPQSDVGVVATVYSYIALLNVVYGYGMEGAFMKYTATLEIGDRKQNFTVPFLAVSCSSVVFSGLMMLGADRLASLTASTSSYALLVSYAGWIVAMDAIAIVPFAALRMQRKAKEFAAIRLAGIVVNVGCNLLFLITYDMGVEGIFVSNIISSGVTLLLLAPFIARNLAPGWNSHLFRELLRFGLPSVPAGLAAMMIQVINRPILEAFTDSATVGLYQANYRLGIFMMLIVSMFDFAWRPFFFSHAKDPDAPKLFARVLTYFILLTSGVFLVLSFFLEDLVRVPLFRGYSLLPSNYWQGIGIVPVILLGYMFLGVSNNVVAGIYIEKKTKHLPVITILGAVVNVLANVLLIPRAGIMGAAVATLLSYVVMALVTYLFVRRWYPVPYEFGRIGKIVVSGVVVYVLHFFLDAGGLDLLWKLLLVGLFGGLMFWMKFFEPAEIARLTRMLRRGTRDEPPPPPTGQIPDPS
jgi:O-antigen/teichoic acid export membrane protein